MNQQTNQHVTTPKAKVIGFIKRAAIATVLSLSSAAMGGLASDHVSPAPVQTTFELRGGELRLTLVRDAAAPSAAKPTLLQSNGGLSTIGATTGQSPTFSTEYRSLTGTGLDAPAFDRVTPETATVETIGTSSASTAVLAQRSPG